MNKHHGYAKLNEFGYWVGCIEYPDGSHAEVTNAKHTEVEAVETADRMAGLADDMDAEHQKNAAFASNFR